MLEPMVWRLGIRAASSVVVGRSAGAMSEALAQARNSIAIGCNAVATGVRSIAIGTDATATEEDQVYIRGLTEELTELQENQGALLSRIEALEAALDGLMTARARDSAPNRRLPSDSNV